MSKVLLSIETVKKCRNCKKLRGILIKCAYGSKTFFRSIIRTAPNHCTKFRQVLRSMKTSPRDWRLKYHTYRNPYTEVLFAWKERLARKRSVGPEGIPGIRKMCDHRECGPPHFSPSFSGMSRNAHDQDVRLAITALNRFTWLERKWEEIRERKKERQRELADSSEKSKDDWTALVTARWPGLPPGEETRGDLGSRPPLQRYGYAEVNDNGTSSTLL